MSVEPRRRVSVLVEDAQGRLLVDDLEGDVEFPGGGIEEGESVEDAALREVLEEAGIRPTSIDTFGQRPTVADGEKTYWRKALGGNPDTSRLGADDDAMDNVRYMPKDEIRAELRAPGGDPDVTEDEEKAMDKVSAYWVGYQSVLKTAGLGDVISDLGRGAREALSPLLGQTKNMVQRQNALRNVRDGRHYARKAGKDPQLAEERILSQMTPQTRESWTQARDYGDVLQDPIDSTFNSWF